MLDGTPDMHSRQSPRLETLHVTTKCYAGCLILRKYRWLAVSVNTLYYRILDLRKF